MIQGHEVMQTVGIGIVGLDASYFKLGVLLNIFSARVVSPVLTMILAFVLYQLLSRLLRNANSMAWG